jgi:trigger factor
MRQQAERDVRGAMLLDRISGLEKLEVTDAEVDDEVAKMAEHYKTTAEEILASMEKQGGTDTIRHNLRTRKTIETIIAKAKVTEGEWLDENAQPAEPDGDGKPKPKKKQPSKKTAKKRT